MYTKLFVFDFDGTIATVPEKPRNKEQAQHYGWNGSDWWGSDASFSKGVYPHKVIIDAMHDAKDSLETKTILITGRRGVVAHCVRKFLRGQGLFGKRMIPESNKDALRRFQQRLDAKRDKVSDKEIISDAHEEYFAGDFCTEEDFPKSGKKKKPDGSTIAHKRYIIKKLVHDKLNSIHLWDDRQDHIAQLILLILDLKKKHSIPDTMLHKVHTVKLPGYPPAISHIKIEEGMSFC